VDVASRIAVTLDEELVKRARSKLGTVLRGKYRLDSILGFGGMAVVYRATHRNRAQLAVKMLHPELSVNADVRSRFLREGYAANSVNHPGAVLVVDDDIAEDGAAFLVMELLVGATAEALLEGHRPSLPLPAAVSIVHQLLDVLASAHAAGIVHRDIKPANLLVTRDGTVKVLDFGIARVLETALGAGQVTGGGLPLGTPAYMAPEQAVARSADIDAQTDVWAAGATLFTLASGDLVHDGPTPAQILVYSATRPSRSLAEVAPAVPAAIAAVVDRALAFDKKDRWPSAAAMRDALGGAYRAVFGAPPSKDALAPLVPGTRSILPGPGDEGLASAPTEHAASFPSSPSSNRSASTSSPVSGERPPSRAPRFAARLVRLGVAGLCALGLAIGVALVGRHLPERPDAGDAGALVAPVQRGPAIVVILDFEYETTDPALVGTVEWLLDCLLWHSTKLTPLSGIGLQSSAKELNPEVGRIDEHMGPKLAARWGLRAVTVRGLVRERGAGYTLELSATDSLSGLRVGAWSETAETQRLVPAAVGRLVGALRTALDDKPADAKEAAQLGFTGSIEAIHEYLLADAELHEGKFDDAVGHARLAVKHDPSFAEAYRTLGIILSDLERRTDGQKQLKEAADRAVGLSDYRRLKILSVYHLTMEEYETAAVEFEELVARWPIDRRNATNLATVYMEEGDVGRALSTIRAAITTSASVIALDDAAQYELAASHFEVASTEARRIVTDFPSYPPDIAGWLAAAEALQGHRAAALAAYDDYEQADPQSGVAAKADFAMFEGRFDDAAVLLRARLDKEANSHAEATAKAWAMLAELRSMQSDAAGAREAARHVPASSDTATLFRTARILTRVGPPKLAAEVAENLKARTGMHARVFSALLDAETLRAAGRAREAVQSMEDAPPPGDFWLTHWTLAQAALDAGAFVVADRELELCISRMGLGTQAFLDDTLTLRYLPAVHYALGRAREGLGRADTKEAYATFLAMEPAAQNDPLVLDARRRLGK
jgi:serine/threonine protein kinase/tetratricopeptide (TPR) repeat protein